MYYLDKIKNHLKNWLEYFLEHFVRIILIFLLIVIFGYIFTLFYEQNIIVLGITLENWFSYISLIALFFTALWATYQFDKNVARKQQEKGAEIAKLFSNDLLFKCTILGNVILDCGIDELFKLDTLDYRVFKNFDRAEINDIYSFDDIFSKLKQLLFSNDTQQIYLRHLEYNISSKSIDEIKDKKYSDEEARKLFVLDNSNMPFKFSQLVSNVLNNLEYICMYIASQSAGSKFVYQSLHQIFLRTVKLLAPIIALQNKDYSDKYYTNIIYVYNEWANLRNNDRMMKHKKVSEKDLYYFTQAEKYLYNELSIALQMDFESTKNYIIKKVEELSY